MESRLVLVFQFGVLFYVTIFPQISGSTDELHIVKFYVDFLCFHLCSVDLIIAKCVGREYVALLLYTVLVKLEIL